jgi:antitoxin component of RelBE/YafQ-DinJ toxin-antitoxin module
MDSSRSGGNPRVKLDAVHIRVDKSAVLRVKGLLIREDVTISEAFRELLNQVLQDERLFVKLIKIVKTHRAAGALSKFNELRHTKHLKQKKNLDQLEKPSEETIELLYSMIEEEIRDGKSDV